MGNFIRPWQRLFLWLAPILLILSVWQAVALVATHIRGVPFPTPLETLLRLGSLLAGSKILGHSLFHHTLDSLFRWSSSFVVAALTGIVFGIAIGWNRILSRITLPGIFVLQLVPGLAWIPVALLLFGVGERTTAFMIWITAFAPIVINVNDGVQRVDVNIIRAARMLGSKRIRFLWCVLLPASLPQIITGLRVGLGNSWRVVVAAEMVVGTGTGLGYTIIQSRWSMDYAAAFVCILVICFIGLGFEHLLLGSLERRSLARRGLSFKDVTP